MWLVYNAYFSLSDNTVLAYFFYIEEKILKSSIMLLKYCLQFFQKNESIICEDNFNLVDLHLIVHLLSTIIFRWFIPVVFDVYK
jgi:hypothetical protein